MAVVSAKRRIMTAKDEGKGHDMLVKSLYSFALHVGYEREATAERRSSVTQPAGQWRAVQVPLKLRCRGCTRVLRESELIGALCKTALHQHR